MLRADVERAVAPALQRSGPGDRVRRRVARHAPRRAASHASHCAGGGYRHHRRRTHYEKTRRHRRTIVLLLLAVAYVTRPPTSETDAPRVPAGVSSVATATQPPGASEDLGALRRARDDSGSRERPRSPPQVRPRTTPDYKLSRRGHWYTVNLDGGPSRMILFPRLSIVGGEPGQPLGAKVEQLVELGRDAIEQPETTRTITGTVATADGHAAPGTVVIAGPGVAFRTLPRSRSPQHRRDANGRNGHLLTRGRCDAELLSAGHGPAGLVERRTRAGRSRIGPRRPAAGRLRAARRDHPPFWPRRASLRERGVSRRTPIPGQLRPRGALRDRPDLRRTYTVSAQVEDGTEAAGTRPGSAKVTVSSKRRHHDRDRNARRRSAGDHARHPEGIAPGPAFVRLIAGERTFQRRFGDVRRRGPGRTRRREAHRIPGDPPPIRGGPRNPRPRAGALHRLRPTCSLTSSRQLSETTGSVSRATRSRPAAARSRCRRRRFTRSKSSRPRSPPINEPAMRSNSSSRVNATARVGLGGMGAGTMQLQGDFRAVEDACGCGQSAPQRRQAKTSMAKARSVATRSRVRWPL